MEIIYVFDLMYENTIPCGIRPLISNILDSSSLHNTNPSRNPSVL